MKQTYLGKTVVVTGGSSGIGKACATAFATGGAMVIELSRSGSDTPYCKHVACDVTNEQQVIQAAALITEQYGKIDVLINNAGFGISGAIEDTEIASAIKQFDVNFFGMTRITKHLLPLVKVAKGIVVNISSVAAVMPIPFQAYYSASKAAINSYTFALANELKPFGVRVTAVMPGDISTAFTDKREKVTASKQYDSRTARSVAQMEKDERQGNPPSTIANKVYRIAQKRRVKPLYTVGGKYVFFVWLGRMLGAKNTNAVLGEMYSK